MPVPKKRRSKSKKRIKRSHWKITIPSLRPCPQCRVLTISHRACIHCGSYKGRQVIQFKEKVAKDKKEF